MSVWFTSDTHYQHKNILLYCPESRGHYADVEEMNRDMVAKWNARVQPNDVVYHLGDVAMGPKNTAGIWVPKLNGRKILIRGNHDRSAETMKTFGFEEVHEQLTIQLDGKFLWLQHKPVLSRGVPAGASYHLCGHVHDLWARQGHVINVGVDQSGMEPKTLAELLVRDLPETYERCYHCNAWLSGALCVNPNCHPPVYD